MCYKIIRYVIQPFNNTQIVNKKNLFKRILWSKKILKYNNYIALKLIFDIVVIIDSIVSNLNFKHNFY